MHQDKLRQLAEDWGFDDPMDLIEATVIDSVSPGICLNEHCQYSTEVEPDCDAGFCEVCGTCSVVSADVLAGVI